MHSVLLFVEKPDAAANLPKNTWEGFGTAAIHTLQRDTTAHTLGESCWLISLETSRHSFVALACAAQERKLKYRVVFLSEEPRWIDSPQTS